jgi:hypothetical protein
MTAGSEAPGPADLVAGWRERLAAGAARLGELRPHLDRVLTAADPVTGERWTGSQVLAHLVELLGYWPGEAERVIDAADPATEFGRSTKDPARLAAVADGRIAEVGPLLDQATARIAAVADWLDGLDEPRLRAVGHHFRRGPMSVAQLVETFVVGHVEEHVAQVSTALAGREAP